MIFCKKTNKLAIIIQGPTLFINEIKTAWKDFKDDLIFSTWVGSEDKYDNNDIVIFNNEPKYTGPYNFNFQQKSTYNGLLKAKELGYTHAIKIRSDYIPTNASEFLKLMDLNKLNVLMWHYTTFLWLSHPTFKGYFDDHFTCAPIDDLLKLWDIEHNFTFSPEIILTWNYIKKLNIDINYILPNLNIKNNLFYIKLSGGISHGFFPQKVNFSNKKLNGRFETYFQNNSEYLKTPEETRKYMNDNYLNFLKYNAKLPEITIINNNKKNLDLFLNDIIYPKTKLKILNINDNIKTDYVIMSDKLLTKYTLIIEYLKKMNLCYFNTITTTKEICDKESNLLTIYEYKNNFKT